jgi:hypothetical protein
MTTAPEPHHFRHPATVRQIANRVAIGGLIYGAGWAVYYWNVVAGRVDPPEGFIAISVAGIALCIMTRTTYWIADRRAGQIEARHDQEMTRIRDQHSAELAEVRDELRLLRQAVERAGDATEMLSSAEKYLNERGGGSVSHLSRARPGL